MEKQKIFVIDDEQNVCMTLKEALETEGFHVNCYQNPNEGLQDVSQKNPDLIITDLLMPEMDGLKLIQRVKALNPEINILIITAHASLESAIESIRAGANDYLIKPFKIEELLKAVQKTLSQKRLVIEKNLGDKSFQARYQIKNLIGKTQEMKEIFKLIEKVAKTESTVLVVGESGVGKEMVARAIHYHSKRKNGSFVSINCAALPETLLESELFGYEKGAFTGAVASKLGLFELAANGTFFLDEVGDMSLSLQAKLLRVLQERILKRVGGIKDIHIDFRLIAATSKNLIDEIKTRRFREDLFYRLNVIPIVIPPLRNRVEDIPLFVNYFLNSHGEKRGFNVKFKLSEAALNVFKSHSWPGNIRELENVIERLTALTDQATIDPEMVSQAIGQGNFSSSSNKSINRNNNLRKALESYESELIKQAIKNARGNQNRAAKKLNLTRQSLHYKVKKYGLENLP